uniref:Mannosyltransferase n=1 Tax=Chenopodium quinoa TaxID=63459 RepID=A0A803M4M0_CHEQI
MARKSAKFLDNYGYDLILGAVAAFYVFAIPYTKVEESFNMQAMHDILYNRQHLAEIRHKFGLQVEAFFVLLTALQFHLLFYSTRPLPNILALGLVNMAYGYWLKGSCYTALQFLVIATLIFRCDVLLLACPIGLQLLLSRSVSLWKAIKCCSTAAILSIGLTVLVDSIMWRRVVWPEFEVFWFNSVLNRSSEWGVSSIHWYFTSALPRSLLAAYPLVLLGLLLDRRILPFLLPVLSFVILYSKLPHKELRFVISSIPVFNMTAAISASRIYNNRKKSFWRLIYIGMLGLFLISLGCTILFFMASYHNYPSGYALRKLHEKDLIAYIQLFTVGGERRILVKEGGGHLNHTGEISVHIDTYSAMNGITRFCESGHPWRYSKEENLASQDYYHRNFTYLLNERSHIDGYQCLFAVHGFSKVNLQKSVPPVVLAKEPKVYAHGSMSNMEILGRNFPGC